MSLDPDLQTYLDTLDAGLQEFARRAALPASALWRPSDVPPVDELQQWADTYLEHPLPSWQTSWLHDALTARALTRRRRHTPGPALVHLLLQQP